MNSKTILEVVKKINGSIHSIGSSEIDKER